MSAARFNWRFRMPRGSPSNGDPSGMKTSAMISAVTARDPLDHGITVNVSRSSFRYISDSEMRANPSIDEPSNHTFDSIASSSFETGIVSAFITPKRSVNMTLMNSTFCSYASDNTSDLVMTVINVMGSGRIDAKNYVVNSSMGSAMVSLYVLRTTFVRVCFTPGHCWIVLSSRSSVEVFQVRALMTWEPSPVIAWTSRISGCAFAARKKSGYLLLDSTVTVMNTATSSPISFGSSFA